MSIPGSMTTAQRMQAWQDYQNRFGHAQSTPTPTPVGQTPAGTNVEPGGLYTPPSNVGSMGSGDMKGDYERGAYSLYSLLLPLLQRQTQFASSLEPQRQALIQQLAQSMTPEGMANLTKMFGQQQQGMATDQGMKEAGMLRSQGLSSGAQAGAILGQQNQATKSTNQFAFDNQSQAGQMRAGQAGLSLLSGAQNPDISNFQGFGSDIYNKPLAVQHGGGLGSILGTVAGAYFGGPAGSAALGRIFGGGGGGGGGQPGANSIDQLAGQLGGYNVFGH